MKKISIEKLIAEAGTEIYLTAEDKKTMRMAILAHQTFHPFRTISSTTTLPLPRNRVWIMPFENVFNTITARTIGAMVLFGTVLSGAGVSYAAENALPGDMLYPVKTDFNEEIISVLTSDPLKRAIWEVARAERRLAEVGSLAKQGMLNENRLTVATAQFREQADRAVAEVSALSKNDPLSAIEVSAGFESALEIHEMVLARLSVDGKESNEDDTQELAVKARTEAKRFAQLRKDAELAIVPGQLDGVNGAIIDATTTATSVKTMNGADTALHTSAEATLRMRASAALALTRLQSEAEHTESLVLDEIMALVAADIATGDRIEKTTPGEAYRAFQAARARADRTLRLLQAELAFDIVLPVADEVGGYESAALSSQKSDVLIDFSTQAAYARREAEAIIALLTKKIASVVDGKVEEGTAVAREKSEHIEQLEALLTQAQTYAIRGDIALTSNDYDDALRLYTKAIVTTGMPIRETASTNEKNAATDEKMVLADNTIYYTKIATGTYQFFGTIIAPLNSHCESVSAEALVSQSGTRAVTLIIRSNEPGGMCTSGLKKEFSVTVSGLQSEAVGVLYINGKRIETFTVRESLNYSPANTRNKSEVMGTSTENEVLTIEEGIISIEKDVSSAASSTFLLPLDSITPLISTTTL